ncbi:hypothetical protein LRP88_11436 [Fusarium phalaenopsidis]
MDINGVLDDVGIGDQDAAGAEGRIRYFNLFVVYQANVRNAKLRVQALLGNVRRLRHAPDGIAIQDPPDALPWTSTALYLKWYETDRPLLEDDNPWCRAQQAKEAPRKAKRRHRSGQDIPQQPAVDALQQPAAKGTSQFLLHHACFLVHQSVKPTSSQLNGLATPGWTP